MVLQIDLTCLCVCLGGTGPQALYCQASIFYSYTPGSTPHVLTASALPIEPASQVLPTMQAVFSHCFLYACFVLLPFKF